MILDRINGPKDLKTLSASERKELAQEIRQAMLKRASIPVSYTHLDVYKRQLYVRAKESIRMLPAAFLPKTSSSFCIPDLKSPACLLCTDHERSS